MQIWICLVVGMLIGFMAGSISSFQHARKDRFVEANRHLRRGAWAAAVTTVLLAFLLLRWPFIDESKNVPYEVTKTVVETVEVPVQVTKWFFWTSTELQPQQVPREVTETEFREQTVRRFSPLMLLPLALLGWAAYGIQLWIARMAWRWCG